MYRDRTALVSCDSSCRCLFFSRIRPPPRPPLFPYTTLFRSDRPPGAARRPGLAAAGAGAGLQGLRQRQPPRGQRSEEHTSELQSHSDLVCRLLLEKKKKMYLEHRNGKADRVLKNEFAF